MEATTLERARGSAADSASAVASAGKVGGDHLTFRVGDVRYAVDILRVQELRSFEAPTRIAGSPSCVLGVNNLRGTIVPVVELRQLLGAGDTPKSDSPTVIVLSWGQQMVGILVDAVSDVSYFVHEKVLAAPPVHAGGVNSHILGLYRLGSETEEQLTVILDIEGLLAPYVSVPGRS